MSHYQNYQQNPNPWSVQQQEYTQQNAQQQPPQAGVFVPQQQQVPHHHHHHHPPQSTDPFSMNNSMNSFNNVDPFLTGVAGNVLRQQGQSYLQRSQAFMQSKMGFLSGGVMQYLFSVNPDYVRSKLMLLFFPFLRRWNYTRIEEQMSGGHKYLPPHQDVNAPDLYIPIVFGLWTYCLLVGIALFISQTFKPEAVYNTVSVSVVAWTLNTFALKILLWILGISSSAPLLELTAYAGYPFVAACVVLVARLVLGPVGYHVVWAYCSLCMATFLVRTMKRVIFQEAHHYGRRAQSSNYLLLGLAVFQFPFLAWLSRLPS